MEMNEHEQNSPDPLSMDVDSIINEILMELDKDRKVEQPIPVPEIIAEKPEPKVQNRKKSASANNGKWQNTLVAYLHDLVYLLATLIIAFLLLFRVVVVSGTSMNNTLYNGDYLLLLNNIFYHDPQYGDIIVASKESFDDGAPIVKRVIATEGQTVDIDFNNGIVYVDGVALVEPYTMTDTNTYEGVQFPVTVEQGHIFVMGDNRNGSKDSRSPEIGQIDKREVIGKVCLLFLPGTNTARNPREFDWGRIGLIGGIDG